MVNKALTHIYMVLDRSGSMASCRKDTEGGFDSFIAEQAAVPGECKVTLVQFDTEYEKVYSLRPLAEVPPLVLVPRGGTALLDAIGRTINDAGAELSAMVEQDRPGAVIMVILTDGEENASRSFTREAVRTMIQRQADTYSWLFVYVGANQDAITVARSMGISAATSMTYSAQNTAQTFASLSVNTVAYRGNIASGLDHAVAVEDAAFTETQRKQAVKDS